MSSFLLPVVLFAFLPLLYQAVGMFRDALALLVRFVEAYESAQGVEPALDAPVRLPYTPLSETLSGTGGYTTSGVDVVRGSLEEEYLRDALEYQQEHGLEQTGTMPLPGGGPLEETQRPVRLTLIR